MKHGYIIRNPTYSYAFDYIAELESRYGLLPILWFTDRKLYLYRYHALPFKNRWHDRLFFAREDQLELLIDDVGRNFQITAALPWEEDAVEPSAAIMEKLGLHTPDPKIIRLFRDKFRLKQHLLKMDPELALHRFFFVDSYAELLARKSEWPERFVIKPVAGVANRENGFFLRTTDDKILKDFFNNNVFQKFIVEDFIEGNEYAVNGQINADGLVCIYSIFHYIRQAAHGRPNLYYRDLLLSSQSKEFPILSRYALQVIKASGLRSSPFHMELMLRGEQPYLIEVGARLPGGNLVYPTAEAHGGGFSCFRLAAHAYMERPEPLGDLCDWQKYDSFRNVLITGLSSREERIMELSGKEDVEALPEFLMWYREPYIGQNLSVTVDGESTPFAVHLATREPNQDLAGLSERVLKLLSWNQNVGPMKRLKFYLLDFFTRFRKRLFILGLELKLRRILRKRSKQPKKPT